LEVDLLYIVIEDMQQLPVFSILVRSAAVEEPFFQSCYTHDWILLQSFTTALKHARSGPANHDVAFS
jgi:hypothetical protein